MELAIGLFFIMFFAVFAFIMGTIIFTFAKSIGQWNKNNNSPRLTVPVSVVSKRMDVSHHRSTGAGGHHYHHSHTYYYVTFQVTESGDRFELELDGGEYGMLAEGDVGNLTFQGTRYLSFERLW